MTNTSGSLLFRICAIFFLVVAAIGLFEGCSSNDKGRSNAVSYNFDIRPILSDNCYACHGRDDNARKAELRLDTPGGALKALKDHKDRFAIVPGKPEESEVIKKITATEADERMPPPESHRSLTMEQINLIADWIKQGAPFEKHWAFIPPAKSELPKLNLQSWPRNEIDHFILDKMERVGLSPNKRARKDHLLRRVSFDLTGLPPSIEMQRKFEVDGSPEAYEIIVDELMASRHYGEKMSVHWLDLARYADSYGYQDDGLRTMWPWRDWVIHAFNENYPYDRFITWQLAGDLIPNKTNPHYS